VLEDKDKGLGTVVLDVLNRSLWRCFLEDKRQIVVDDKVWELLVKKIRKNSGTTVQEDKDKIPGTQLLEKKN
jgi:hypothetical protein